MKATGSIRRRGLWKSLSATALIAGLATVAPLAHAQTTANTSPGQTDALPKRLACTFSQGGTSSYADGTFKRSTPSPLAFEIDAVDLAAQTAALKASSGERAAGELRIVRALNANHFLEVAAEGFLNLTTVYDRDPKTGQWPAVHSRHFGFFGQAVVAQYTGACKSLDTP